MAALDLLLSLSIPALIIIYLLVAPYTKVEESFNLQATHDILVYGTPTSNIRERLSLFDHFDFPGAVPRTFLGPVLLTGISQPIIALVGFQHAQSVVRAVLGLANAAALLVFKANVERAFGKPVARWYALLQVSQFHVMFYASRTLPNMFAFGLTTLALAQLLPHPDPRRRTRRFRLAIALLTSATAIFRSELAILLVVVALYGLSAPLISLGRVIPPFLLSFAFALLVSVPLDSYFWQQGILWPELWGFYYNTVLGSASAWGVSPWHWYFTSALPKILTNPLAWLVLLPAALWSGDATTRKGARLLAVPPLLFVAIYSFQPHKEARFIFYAAPPLTAAAALGAQRVFARRGESAVRQLGALAVAASVPLSLAASAAMLTVSALNYPGGEALDALKGLLLLQSSSAPSSGAATDLGRTVLVHTDVLACMTGVTLFGQHLHWGSRMPIPPLKRQSLGVTTTTTHSGGGSSAETDMKGEAGGIGEVTLAFDKTEDPAALRSPAFWARFDYVLAEDPAAASPAAAPDSGDAVVAWDVVGAVEGFAGIEIVKPGSSSSSDVEEGRGGGGGYRVFGRGALVKEIRDRVTALTGGWWVGPRMVPKVYILRRMRGGEKERRAVAA